MESRSSICKTNDAPLCGAGCENQLDNEIDMICQHDVFRFRAISHTFIEELSFLTDTFLNIFFFFKDLPIVCPL